MSRIFNYLTRGFRARPPAPTSQTSSQRNDENDETPDEVLTKYHQQAQDDERLPLFSCKNHESVTWTNTHQYRKQHHNFNYDHRIYYKLWDSLIYGASVLVIARFMGGYMVNKKVSRDETTRKRHVTLRERWNELSVLPHNTTVRNVLSKMPQVSIPCSTAYAADEADEDKSEPSLKIVKAPGHFDNSFSGKKTLLTCTEHDSKDFLVFESKSTKNKDKEGKNQLLSEEDLEEFISSAQECVGMTYNIQGITSYKSGSYREAFQCFELGSEGGSSKAQFNLGLCYHLGKGTKKDMKKAMREYRRAARQGHKMAQYNLALLLLEHTDVVKITHALSLLEKAAEQGLVQAQCLLGSYLAQNGNHYNMKKAVRMFKLAADQGDTLSTYHLAECYEHGLGGLDIDPVKAFDLYATAAGQGHSDSQFKMASILLNGCPGVDKNVDLATEIFKKAADSGHVKSLRKYTELKKKSVLCKKMNKSYLLGNNCIPRNTIDLSQLVPEIMLMNTTVDKPQVSHPTLQELSLAAPVLDRPFVSNVHRVSTWPSNLFQQDIIVSHPELTK